MAGEPKKHKLFTSYFPLICGGGDMRWQWWPALNTVTMCEICSRGYIHMEIQMLSDRTPFSRHLLFLPAVFM